jgi:hypothetical protein
MCFKIAPNQRTQPRGSSTGVISGVAVKNLLPESEQMLYTCFNIRFRADTFIGA